MKRKFLMKKGLCMILSGMLCVGMNVPVMAQETPKSVVETEAESSETADEVVSEEQDVNQTDSKKDTEQESSEVNSKEAEASTQQTEDTENPEAGDSEQESEEMTVQNTQEEESVPEENVEDQSEAAGETGEITENKEASSDFVIENGVLTSYTGKGGNITIPSNVIEIGSFAFYNKNSITGVTIPSSVQKIDTYAFSNCSKLTTLGLSNGIITIDDFAFAECKELNTFDIPSTLESIGNRAFEKTGITKLIIPDSVQNIEESAFSQCSNLQKVVLGKGITRLPAWLFYSCYALQTVDIRGEVTGFGEYAFSGCSSLMTINIPDTTTIIGESCFYNCTSLKQLKLGNMITNIGPRAFGNCKSLEQLYVPYCLSVWGEDVVWACYSLTAYIYADAPKAIEWAKEQNVNYQLIGEFKLNKVIGLQAFSAGTNKVNLTWNATDSSEGYIIYAKKNGKYAYCGMTNKLSYTDTKASMTDYNFYWVYPYITNPSTNKRTIGKASGYVYAKGTPLAVKSLKASPAGKNKVTLSWTKNSDVTGYIIYKKNASTGKFEYLSMTSSTKYTDNNASESNYNFYRVYPYVMSNGTRVLGASNAYVYAKGILPSVTNLKATSGTNGVTVSWNKLQGAEGYVIYKKNTSTGKFEYYTMTSKTSYVDKKASRANYSFYRVYPYYTNDAGKRILGISDTYVYAKKK